MKTERRTFLKMIGAALIAPLLPAPTKEPTWEELQSPPKAGDIVKTRCGCEACKSGLPMDEWVKRKRAEAMRPRHSVQEWSANLEPGQIYEDVDGHYHEPKLRFAILLLSRDKEDDGQYYWKCADFMKYSIGAEIRLYTDEEIGEFHYRGRIMTLSETNV